MFEGLLNGTEMKPAVMATEEQVLFGAFWEIPSPLKCPVVGLGISDEEGRRLLKKCGRQSKSLAPWEVHRDIMEEVGDATPVARRVDAFLKRKFADAVKETRFLPEKQLLPLLKSAIARGDAAEALYCVAMRRDLSVETLVSVSGEAHMMGHTTAVALFEARAKELKNAEKAKALAEALDEERRERRRLGRELERLAAQVKGLESALKKKSIAPTASVQPDDAVNQGGEDASQLKEERAMRLERERECHALNREVRSLEREKRKLQIRSMDLANENQTLGDEVMSLAIGRPAPPLRAMACEGRGCCTCPEMETCSRRVLMVGGLSRMEPHYRRVAEAKGLDFEYHDGTMSGGRKCLENQVSRCDMVVCPVSCNSHNAARSVKKLCAKHNKEIRFLPTSSISALTGALVDMPGL